MADVSNFYVSEEEFAKKFIALVKVTLPDLPIVQANQNATQPVDILNGEELMVFDIELVRKTGTDYVIGTDGEIDGNFRLAGDREIQVAIEMFSPRALTVLTHLRDIWETPEYVDVQYNLGIMEKRQSAPPRNSTRKHSKEKFVKSARYITQFHMGVVYTSGDVKLGDITSADVSTGTIT